MKRWIYCTDSMCYFFCHKVTYFCLSLQLDLSLIAHFFPSIPCVARRAVWGRKLLLTCRNFSTSQQQCETFLDELYLSVCHYTDFVMCVCVCSYWCHSYWREECFHFLTCWGTNDWFKKDRGISRTSKGCRVIFCSYPECSVISHREHYGHGLLCKGTAQRSGMQGMASVGLDSPLVTTGMNNMTPWQTDRQTDTGSLHLFTFSFCLLIVVNTIKTSSNSCTFSFFLFVSVSFSGFLFLTQSTATSRCRWWAARSRRLPPLLSVKRKRAAWPKQVAPPGFSSPLIGQQSTPSDTGHFPLGNSLRFMPLLVRGTAFEDITAAMLSSPTSWPCHSRQTGWRRVAKMFVDFFGWMILYLCGDKSMIL